MKKEIDFINNKNLREESINRVDVLDKVKNLLLLPNSEFATTEQVSKYYEVGKEAITSLVHDNRDEIEADGYKIIKGKEIVNTHVISFKEFTTNRANYKFIY